METHMLTGLQRWQSLSIDAKSSDSMPDLEGRVTAQLAGIRQDWGQEPANNKPLADEYLSFFTEMHNESVRACNQTGNERSTLRNFRKKIEPLEWASYEYGNSISPQWSHPNMLTFPFLTATGIGLGLYVAASIEGVHRIRDMSCLGSCGAPLLGIAAVFAAYIGIKSLTMTGPSTEQIHKAADIYVGMINQYIDNSVKSE
jgi:hypothetical protein